MYDNCNKIFFVIICGSERVKITMSCGLRLHQQWWKVIGEIK